METCSISNVNYNETNAKPIILHFENGKLDEGSVHHLSSQIFRDKINTYHAAVATKDLVYSGVVKEDSSYNNFIAIRNKRTNKMRLIAVDHAMLAPVFMHEKNLLDLSSETKDLSVTELNKQFGSKRIKRQTEQRERMKLDVENVKEQLEQTVADVKVDVEQMVPNLDENDSEYKPPVNRNATKIEEVYSLNRIVPPEVLESMSEEIERIFNDSEEDMGTTKFVMEQIKSLSTSDEDEHRSWLFLYIDCLIKFMLSPSKVINTKKYNACLYSNMANLHILNNFTVSSPRGRLRPNVMRDKCLCYILVLSTIACKYKLNLESVSKQLKVGIKKLQDVCRLLALTTSGDVAALKLPLPAPVSVNKRSRKKS